MGAYYWLYVVSRWNGDDLSGGAGYRGWLGAVVTTWSATADDYETACVGTCLGSFDDTEAAVEVVDADMVADVA